MPNSDESQKAIQGEFDSLFTPFRARVIGYLCRLTGSAAEAEDLTQETLLAAYRQRSGFRPGSSPLAYLIGIARRRWRDGKRSAHATDELHDGFAQANQTADWIDSLTLRSALDKLPEPERRALELTAIEGHTYKEAAAILGEPVGTLKWRVHQAMRQLRQLLTSDEHDGGESL